MCGINGVINSQRTESELISIISSMNISLADRGPDGAGVFINCNAALGQTRLAIVDAGNMEAGQPMENERHVITFNGEVYNHIELREELEKKGIRFRTNCDTEVLLEGFSAFGDKVLQRINGQFAFAVYDKKTGETFLARDRTAMKPLYFSLNGSELQFSSRAKSLAGNIGFSPDLDSISSLLINGSAFAAGEEPLGSSIYGGVESMNPGEYMRVKADGKIERSRYYSLPISDIDNPESEEACIQKMRGVLETAVKARIPDEVKIGCALSGGLDSSIVTAIVADNCSGDVVAACIRYTADSHNPDYEHAVILAETRGNIRLVPSDLSPENFLDGLEGMVSALGIHDSIRQLAMFRNYRVLAENGVKVALTGEGADEFNWGYWHRFPGLKCDQEACSTEDGFSQLVAGRKRYVEQLIAEKQGGVDFDRGIRYLADIYKSFGTSDSTRRMAAVYGVDFLGFLNKANDRCAMASSIEARCPFQDVDVIRTCLGIPREYQIKGESEKHILREAFIDVLPSEIYSRPKSPLPAASHIDYHRAIAREFERRIAVVDSTIWDYFSRGTFESIAANYNRRIEELKCSCGPEEAGAALMAWRPISGSCNIIHGDDIRTNDVFKLLTTMVWYDQNCRGDANE